MMCSKWFDFFKLKASLKRLDYFKFFFETSELAIIMGEIIQIHIYPNNNKNDDD